MDFGFWCSCSIALLYRLSYWLISAFWLLVIGSRMRGVCLVGVWGALCADS